MPQITRPVLPEAEDHMFVQVDTPETILGAAFASLTIEINSLRPDALPLYGDATPRNMEDCLELVRNGAWTPATIHFTSTRQLVGIHWLHDKKGDTAWTGGYAMPDFRRHFNIWIKNEGGKRILEVWNKMGYMHIHAAQFVWNEAAIRWSLEKGYHEVGVQENFILAGGLPRDCMIHTSRQEDIELARSDAKERAIGPS